MNIQGNTEGISAASGARSPTATGGAAKGHHLEEGTRGWRAERLASGGRKFRRSNCIPKFALQQIEKARATTVEGDSVFQTVSSFQATAISLIVEVADKRQKGKSPAEDDGYRPVSSVCICEYPTCTCKAFQQSDGKKEYQVCEHMYYVFIFELGKDVKEHMSMHQPVLQRAELEVLLKKTMEVERDE